MLLINLIENYNSAINITFLHNYILITMILLANKKIHFLDFDAGFVDAAVAFAFAVP